MSSFFHLRLYVAQLERVFSVDARRSVAISISEVLTYLTFSSQRNRKLRNFDARTTDSEASACHEQQTGRLNSKKSATCTCHSTVQLLRFPYESRFGDFIASSLVLTMPWAGISDAWDVVLPRRRRNSRSAVAATNSNANRRRLTCACHAFRRALSRLTLPPPSDACSTGCDRYRLLTLAHLQASFATAV